MEQVISPKDTTNNINSNTKHTTNNRDKVNIITTKIIIKIQSLLSFHFYFIFLLIFDLNLLHNYL
jgi:hypothetical protein